jgi:hypothetical protein
MINLKAIDKNYLLIIFFGSSALILSLVIGIFSGNGIATVFIRAITNMILFSILGFVCLFVIKKFVPELYQIISSVNIEKDVEIKSDDSAIKDDKNNSHNKDNSTATNNNVPSQNDVTLNMGREDTELENEFTKMEKPGETYSSLGVDKNDSTSGSQKLFKDNKIKYEPKIAAQAIRTMMKRDE